MRKIDPGLVRLAIVLLVLSALLYGVTYVVLGRPGDILFNTLLDVAFIPVQVLIVGLVIDGLLARREKAALIDKLNMVIGAFFSEAGRELLGRLAAFDADVGRIRPYMLVRQDWTPADFARAIAGIADSQPAVDILNGDPASLRDFLDEKRDFLLRLLESPSLLEHERFTDTLWAITHLAEELEFRSGFAELPVADLAHLSLDMRRAYAALLSEWLEHLRHLKTAYPYLFSLAVRTNPFDPEADAEVTA